MTLDEIRKRNRNMALVFLISFLMSLVVTSPVCFLWPLIILLALLIGYNVSRKMTDGKAFIGPPFEVHHIFPRKKFRKKIIIMDFYNMKWNRIKLAKEEHRVYVHGQTDLDGVTSGVWGNIDEYVIPELMVRRIFGFEWHK